MWPELNFNGWEDTLYTLHMWTQIVGKVKLKLAPFLNHWWETAFYVTARGLTTGRIPYDGEIFQVDFDFQDHALSIHGNNRKTTTLSLKPQTVAAFYAKFMDALKAHGINVKIWKVPVEVPEPVIPFDRDTEHASYNRDYVTRWWRILVKANIAFDRFRTPFGGKSSPVHFFWGSFDLSGSRFSGRPAEPPKMKGVLGKIMKYAENEENFAFGFWPGDQRLTQPAFYSYMYPQPKGAQAVKLTGGASFNEQLGEYILTYEFVRKSKNPEKVILGFLESTYLKTATLAGWDIASLRAKVPRI